MSKVVTLASITSDDLEDYCNEDMESEDKTARMKAVRKLLNGRVKVGGYFDWKEEGKMLRYLLKTFRKYPEFKYAYEAYPGGDGWQIVFSKVKLPKAELIA